MDMMPCLSFLLGPTLGALIGYVTNDLAIRMMFRPHRAKHLLGMRLPFTPGVIPKERGRIAEAIGTSISDNLMNREVLEKNLLAPEMVDKLGKAYDQFVGRQMVNTQPLRMLLRRFLSEKDIETIKADTKEQLAMQIYARLDDSEIGRMVAHTVVKHVMGKMETNRLGGLLNTAQLLSALTEPVERMLAKHIDGVIHEHGADIVGNLVGKETDQLLDTQVCLLLIGHEEQLAQLRSLLIDAYTALITTHLPKILAAVDIHRIVTDRINEMDMEECEQIILQVMKKELRAIVWLGALLGAVIGTVNSLF